MPVPALPGTEVEALAYAQREAESPGAGDFAGGEIGFFPVLLVAAMIVVVVILLVQEKPA